MPADLQAIKLRAERSLPPDVAAAIREAGIVLTLEAANGDSRPLVDISDELAELELLPQAIESKAAARKQQPAIRTYFAPA
jgi:hypothetical protein